MLRSRLSRLPRLPGTLALGVAGIALSGASSGAGCSPTKPTELVPGALSQIEVPKDLSGIKIEVLADGERKFNQSYIAQNGVAFLPATLGVVAGGSAETTVTVLIGGYNAAGVAGPEFGDPTQDVGAVGTDPTGPGPRVRRGSVQTYVDQHTLFLPMPLSYSCWGNDCSQGGTSNDTCKANACVSSTTDATKLADFDPSMVDGTQDCFSPSSCFSPQTTTTAVLLDADKCLYEVPPGQTLGLGLNVRILYQDMQLVPNSVTGTNVPEVVPTSEQEILNVEDPGGAQEGYTVPDPSKPLQFELAAGLCSLVKATATPPAGIAVKTHYHTISAVQVSTACPSKPQLLPVCASEQNSPTVESDGGTTTTVVCNQPITLDPAPSAIYMVMDDSSIMSGAFGSEGYATAMGLSLSNPVFKRTYVAFEFLDHLGTLTTPDECTATTTQYTTPGRSGVPHSLDFGLANVVQPGIATLLLNPKPPEPGADGAMPANGFAPLYLEAAMRPDVGAPRHVQDFAASIGEPLQIGAVMYFVNRAPQSTGTADAGVIIDSGTSAMMTLPTGADCDPAIDTARDGNGQTALEQEIAAADKNGVQSYFVVLANALYEVGTPLQYFQGVQSALKTQGVKTMQVLDATQPKTKIANVLASFSDIVTALGTCLYEKPPGVDTNGKLKFTLPIPTPFASQAPAPLSVPLDPNCNESTADTANGWNVETSDAGVDHVRICGTGSGQYCWELRQSVLAVSAEVLGSSDAGSALGAGGGDAGTPPIPEVPVTVTMPCTGN
jgi:hypothetical protein